MDFNASTYHDALIRSPLLCRSACPLSGSFLVSLCWLVSLAWILACFSLLFVLLGFSPKKNFPL